MGEPEPLPPAFAGIYGEKCADFLTRKKPPKTTFSINGGAGFTPNEMHG